jgi:hypothetical protein
MLVLASLASSPQVVAVAVAVAGLVEVVLRLGGDIRRRCWKSCRRLWKWEPCRPCWEVISCGGKVQCACTELGDTATRRLESKLSRYFSSHSMERQSKALE